MSDVALLASLAATDLKNRVRHVASRSRFKISVILAFSIVFWWSLFRLFLWGKRWKRC